MAQSGRNTVKSRTPSQESFLRDSPAGSAPPVTLVRTAGVESDQLFMVPHALGPRTGPLQQISTENDEDCYCVAREEGVQTLNINHFHFYCGQCN